jgi:hypothetical protein
MFGTTDAPGIIPQSIDDIFKAVDIDEVQPHFSKIRPKMYVLARVDRLGYFRLASDCLLLAVLKISEVAKIVVILFPHYWSSIHFANKMGWATIWAIFHKHTWSLWF